MLIALLAAWLLTSGSDPRGSAWLLQDIDRTRSNVSRVVTEPQRRDDVLKTIDRMKAIDAEHVAQTKEAHRQVLAEAGRRATPSAELVKQLESLESKARAAANQLIAFRFEAKERMTREEWRAVFGKTEPGKR